MKVTKKSDKSGMVPGSLVYVGDDSTKHNIQIELIEYDENSFKQIQISNFAQFKEVKNNPLCSWINIDGVHDVDLIKELGDVFNIHPLILEDILNTTQRPKIEFSDDYIYTTLKMIIYDEKNETFTKEQLSVILLKNVVITIQEVPGDIFQKIRDRIKTDTGRIRKSEVDYLFYTLLDSIVDEYFKVIERLDFELEEVEDRIEEYEGSIQDIHWLKKELLYIRRSISPVREIISTLIRSESYLINEKSKVFLRDVYDHTIQIIENVEIIRDIVSGLIDLYLSTVSNRMNEVMKFLTVFASIFIPLTFVTGIYGMNFEYMPELKWKYGYFYMLGFLFATGSSLFYIFKKKKWF